MKWKHAHIAARRDIRSSTSIESLEGRLLFHHGFGGFGHGGGFGFGGDGGGFGRGLNSIEFSQAPSLVQSGLDAVATKDGLAAPASTSTQTVFLGNRNGIETYSIDISGTGVESVLTVDQNGNPITAPTNGTTAYSTVPAAVMTEASALATALTLTVPALTDNVRVSTPAGGTSVYTIRLTSTTATTGRVHGRTVRIDASGNPVGNQNLPFAAIPASIQNDLNGDRPSGAAALAATSTQTVRIRTNSGITTYSTTYTTTGTSTTVTVNASGGLAKLPSHSTTTFGAIPAKAQAEINTLAADNGVTAAIDPAANVQVYDEANGTTIYSVNVNGSKTGSSGNTFTFNLTISVDQDGNPTTLPGGGGFGGRFGDFGGGGAFFGGSGFFGRRRR